MIADLHVCQAYREYKELHQLWPQQILERMTGRPAGECLQACRDAFSKGLIDYDRALRSGWLTRKGEALLGGRALPEMPPHMRFDSNNKESNVT